MQRKAKGSSQVKYTLVAVYNRETILRAYAVTSPVCAWLAVFDVTLEKAT